MPETRRDQQKLWLILFQIKGVRSRLNFLVVQRWVFAGLAILIGAAGLTLFAAEKLGPLTFLAFATVVAAAAMVWIVRETIRLWVTRNSPERAAAIADDRSQMKGRLTTVRSLAGARQRSPLWDYLIEDTYSRRDEFEPARVAPRWFSRALYPLIGAILLAALAHPAARLTRLPQGPAPLVAAPPDQISEDIGNLEIHPADPALQPNTEIYADPETLQKLNEKIAAAEEAKRNRPPLSKLIDRARSFADAFQDRLNGVDRSQSGRVQMRLTDRNPGAPNQTESNHANPGGNKRKARPNGLAGNGQPGRTGPSQPGEAQGSTPSANALQGDELASKDPSLMMPPGSAQSPEREGNSPTAGNAEGGDGSNHGSGSDPGGLFGPAAAQPVGSDTFKIAIDAEPSDEASTPGSPTYAPPKVRVPLDSYQYPDEPLARAAVPAGDENTIKRVFER